MPGKPVFMRLPGFSFFGGNAISSPSFRAFHSGTIEGWKSLNFAPTPKGNRKKNIWPRKCEKCSSAIYFLTPVFMPARKALRNPRRSHWPPALPEWWCRSRGRHICRASRYVSANGKMKKRREPVKTYLCGFPAFSYPSTGLKLSCRREKNSTIF